MAFAREWLQKTDVRFSLVAEQREELSSLRNYGMLKYGY